MIFTMAMNDALKDSNQILRDAVLLQPLRIIAALRR